MDVKVRGAGCLDVLGCFLSLGVLPIMLMMQTRSIPRQVTEEGFVTSSGKSIPWSQFTAAKVTHYYVKASNLSKGSYTGTRFELRHADGTLKFTSSRIINGKEVIDFILSHLPPDIVTQTKM